MSSVSTSRRSSAGKNVLVFFIVFIILEVLVIFGVGKVFKNKDVTPSIMGYSLFMTKEDLVQNGPSGTVVAVPKNVLVIASDGLPDPKSKIGSAILCEEVDGVGSGVFWLADMNSKEGKDGVDFTVTNGAQGHVIKSSNIVGVCASYFVTAGAVINFVTQKFGMIVCVIVLVFLLLLIELIIAIATHGSDEDDDDDDDDEDDEEEDDEKSVELDDFLFGGQNEGEQIAKRRKKSVPAFEEENEDEEDFKPVRKKQSPPDGFEFERPAKRQNEDRIDLSFKPADEAPAAAESFAAVQQMPMQQAPVQQPVQDNGLGVNTAPQQSADDSFEAQAAAADRAISRRNDGRRPRRRRPVGAGTRNINSDTSLEDLMKLMEEEQNKLKNQIK